MFCCANCAYKTNRKFNIKKHINNVHNRDANDEELTKKDDVTQILAEPTQMLADPTQMFADPTQMFADMASICVATTQILAKHKKIFCDLCQKEFKTPHGFRNHQKICKGVVNTLECHHCHKVFTKQQAKSKHIKICKVKNGKELALQALQNIPLTNNITNNTQTNNQMNNNQTNIYIQSYRPPYQRREPYNYRNENVENITDFGCENTEYISDEIKEQIALACNIKKMIDLVHFNALHPENHNVRENDNNSYVILRDKSWHLETKDDVHHNIYRNSQININDYRFKYMLTSNISEEQKENMLDQMTILDDPEKKKRTYKYIGIKIKENTDHYSNKMNNLETNVNQPLMVTM